MRCDKCTEHDCAKDGHVVDWRFEWTSYGDTARQYRCPICRQFFKVPVCDSCGNTFPQVTLEMPR